MAVTLWIRRGEAASEEAVAFLRAHGFRPDRVLDVATTPPTEQDLRGLGAATAATTPMLLTPRGGLVGFRERKWRDFLDIGKGRS